MEDTGAPSNEAVPRVPKYSIVGILVGFALFHSSMSLFWQFGSYYLYTGIGETQFFLIGLVGGLPILVGISSLYLWGALSDRWQQRKPFMIIGFAAMTLAFIAYLFVRDTIGFLLVTCLANLFGMTAVPMANTYLTEVQKQKGGAVGLLLATNSFGWAFGAFGGAILFDMIQMSGLFALGAVFYCVGGIIVGVFVREVPYQELKSTDSEDSSNPPTQENPFQLPIRFLFILALTMGLSNIGVNAFSHFFGIFLISEIGGTPGLVGLANGFAALLGLVFTLAAGYSSDRIGRKPILLVGLLGYTIFMGIYFFIVDPLIATVLWVIPLYPLAYTAGLSSAADVSHPTLRGRAIAIVSTAYQLGGGIGPIIGGAVVQFLTITLRGNMILTAVLNLVSFLIVGLLLPETLRKTRKPVRE